MARKKVADLFEVINKNLPDMASAKLTNDDTQIKLIAPSLPSSFFDLLTDQKATYRVYRSGNSVTVKITGVNS